MAPTGFPKPHLCQFDWTQLKKGGKQKDKDKEQLFQMGGQVSGPLAGEEDNSPKACFLTS